MSEPQINEVWEREEKASTGVIMSPVQYEKFMEKI